MTLEELKALYEDGSITDITVYEYYSNNEEELASLSGEDLVQMGYVTNIATAAEITAEHPDQVTFSITATPEGATVTINDEEQTEVTVEYGTEVSWSVAMEDYETQSGSEKVTKNTVKEITLKKEQVTLTINTTPVEATVKFNDGDVDPDKAITVDKGTSVKYSVEAEGYNSKEDTIQVDETKTEEVSLTKKQYDFTINPTPDDATVTIGGEQVKTKKVEHGSNVEWSVKKAGYTTQSDTESNVTGPVTKDITLVAIDVTLTVTCDEPGAQIKLGTEEGSLAVKDSITAKFDSTVYYEVSAEGYTTQKGNVKLTETSGTQTKDITLERAAAGDDPMEILVDDGK